MLTNSRRLITAALLGLSVAGAGLAAEPEKKFYVDDPLWISPKPVAASPAARKLSDYYDFLENQFFSPADRSRNGFPPSPSLAVNTVDEAPNSAWYTNRHAVRRMTLEELKAGAGAMTQPESGTWTVVAAKVEGVTPGLRIRDAAGRQYLLKFDPPSNPEMASAADVVTSKFFHALGYNVPDNYIVRFERSRLTVDSEATIKDATGHRRPIRPADIDALLTKVARPVNGSYRAMASRLIDGRPIGPFQYHGTRGDDPNDLVEHENRRDLRGLRTFCAWLGHDDSRAINTLDVVTDDNGTSFVKHYLIDFGATLGSASTRANSPRDGSAYLFDWKSSALQFFSLGLYIPHWQQAKYPDLPAVGRFEYAVFDPVHWVGDYPNPAFRNETPSDRTWAARKIAAFTDGEIRALVETGQYSDPRAEEWVARCLIERRRKIVSAFLEGIPGLDDFSIRRNELQWSYAGPGTAPVVSIQWHRFDNRSGERTALAGATTTKGPQASGAEFLVAELTDKTGSIVSVFVRMRPQPVVVGVERRLLPSRQKRGQGELNVGS